MRFAAIFRRQPSAVSRSGGEQAEKLLAESFRTLGQVCARLADYIDSQRLARAGYEAQGKFLERLEKKDPP